MGIRHDFDSRENFLSTGMSKLIFFEQQSSYKKKIIYTIGDCYEIQLFLFPTCIHIPAAFCGCPMATLMPATVTGSVVTPADDTTAAGTDTTGGFARATCAACGVWAWICPCAWSWEAGTRV